MKLTNFYSQHLTRVNHIWRYNYWCENTLNNASHLFLPFGRQYNSSFKQIDAHQNRFRRSLFERGGRIFSSRMIIYLQSDILQISSNEEKKCIHEAIRETAKAISLKFFWNIFWLQDKSTLKDKKLTNFYSQYLTRVNHISRYNYWCENILNNTSNLFLPFGIQYNSSFKQFDTHQYRVFDGLYSKREGEYFP